AYLGSILGLVLNLAEPPCTDPYARWCDRESP
ncbi:unnamed protein product, partial [marine sediment metagenome]